MGDRPAREIPGGALARVGLRYHPPRAEPKKMIRPPPSWREPPDPVDMNHAHAHDPRAPRPTIAVSMGDPAGIGAEIIVKALADESLRQQARFHIYGLNDLLIHAAESAGIEPYWWRVPRTRRAVNLPRPGDSDRAREVVVIDDDRFPEAGLLASDTRHGPSKIGGEASLGFLDDCLRATRLESDRPGRADAVVTAPISKSSWRLAGLKRFPGHTELLADFAGVKRQAMMFIAPKLRVVLATIHIPLMEIQNVLTIGKVFDPIDLAYDACRRDFGIRHPRIAVCGLNPHASEEGLFGDEEERLIAPAIRQACEHGMDVEGPFPADTVFNAAIAGRFDIVVAMYHDQGTIPIKLLARDEAVNMTLGLPFPRTSPDHGTAFDIAGGNRAHPGSMAAALQLAARISARRIVNARTLE